jgi:hypothetical protein
MENCNMFSMYNECTWHIDKWRKTNRYVFYTLKLKHPTGKFTKSKEIIS